ncbi:hypothetical protein BJX62DRAFT_201912 [Aspergillus germanicus]
MLQIMFGITGLLTLMEQFVVQVMPSQLPIGPLPQYTFGLPSINIHLATLPP